MTKKLKKTLVIFGYDLNYLLETSLHIRNEYSNARRCVFIPQALCLPKPFAEIWSTKVTVHRGGGTYYTVMPFKFFINLKKNFLLFFFFFSLRFTNIKWNFQELKKKHCQRLKGAQGFQVCWNHLDVQGEPFQKLGTLVIFS